MNCVIPINKPPGFTSFDIVAIMRKIIGIKRIGHGGTLDPIAEGVLPVFVGKAARAADIIPDKTKRYIAGFRLGSDTDTLDRTGTETKKYTRSVGDEDINEAICRFTGKIKQIPPMYSAVSVNGKRLYELAREGKTIEREPRDAEIYSLSLLNFDKDNQSGTIDVECSAGTYVRTLINDIAHAAGSGGYMTSLVRTRSCGFDIQESVTPDEFRKLFDENKAESVMMPVDRLFKNLPSVHLSPVQEKLYKNGIKLKASKLFIKNDAAQYRIYDSCGSFISLASVCTEDGEKKLRVYKNFF